MEQINKKTVISSLFWKFMERFGTQGVQFIVQIILARLLLPEEYGIVALTTIFISIANVFIQQGFSVALVQKKEVDEKDLSSVFYLNLLVATILYIVIFFASPYIAEFYNQPMLTNVLRILSLTLFMGAVNSVQNAIVSRTMKFKKYFYSSISGIIVSGVVGIIAAYCGLGVWALVINQLTNVFIIMAVLWFTVKWRPKPVFLIDRIKTLFSFGWKILCSGLIDTIYNETYGLVIGKTYNSEALGYYNRGQHFPKIIATNIDGAINTVMLPTFSSKQDDKKRLKGMVRRSIKTSSYIIFAIMIGLAAIAEPMTKLILTDKWLPCVPFIQMLSISYAFLPIHTANLQAINAVGRSDIYLKLEIIKKIVGITVLIISIPFGIYAMAGMKILTSIIATFINSYPNKKLLNYSFKEQVKDLLPSFLLASIMGMIVYSITFLNLGSLITIVLQLIIGAIFYITVSYIFKLDSFMYIIKNVKALKDEKAVQ